jgi:hypothetical protein
MPGGLGYELRMSSTIGQAISMGITPELTWGPAPLDIFAPEFKHYLPVVSFMHELKKFSKPVLLKPFIECNGMFVRIGRGTYAVYSDGMTAQDVKSMSDNWVASHSE